MPLLTACMDMPESLNARARKSVEKFSELMMSLTMMQETMKLTELVQYVIDTAGLESQYTKEDNDENRSRVENIREFVGAVKEFEEKSDHPTLTDYLENGNIRNSVNFPACDMGVCQAESRIAVLHMNIPNMIGQITGILAAQGVNITDMTNKSRDKYAYTLLDLEHKPEAATIEKLKAIEGVLRVRKVK